MKFNELRKINVTEKVEKKNGLSYLSWAWAVDTLLQHDPMATWEYKPHQMWGDTVMVFCEVNAFGVSRTAQLPVMDHRNKAISEPDAFQVNTAMQRCLAKAISLHGIGLYIYAGEDLPEEAKEDPTDHHKAYFYKPQATFCLSTLIFLKSSSASFISSVQTKPFSIAYCNSCSTKSENSDTVSEAVEGSISFTWPPGSSTTREGRNLVLAHSCQMS